MTRRLRSTVLIALPLAAWLGISAGGAIASALPGCENPSDPALNQYCDSLPSAGGPQTAGSGGGGRTVAAAGTQQSAAGAATGANAGAAGGSGSANGGSATGGSPTIVPAAGVGGATVTIRSAARAEKRAAAASVRQALTTLPAPMGTHLALKPSAAKVGGFGSPTTWIVVIVAALALALVSSTVLRRRQGGTGSS